MTYSFDFKTMNKSTLPEFIESLHPTFAEHAISMKEILSNEDIMEEYTLQERDAVPKIVASNILLHWIVFTSEFANEDQKYIKHLLKANILHSAMYMSKAEYLLVISYQMLFNFLNESTVSKSNALCQLKIAELQRLNGILIHFSDDDFKVIKEFVNLIQELDKEAGGDYLRKLKTVKVSEPVITCWDLFTEDSILDVINKLQSLEKQDNHFYTFED